MKHYQQLTLEQRYQICACVRARMTNAAIAEVVGVHPTTIGREIKRNHGGNAYFAQQAHAQAQNRRRRPASRWTPALVALVERWLRLEWSPEQVSSRLMSLRIGLSHTSIYRHIDIDRRRGGDLYRGLRVKHFRWPNRRGRPDRRGQLVGCVSIEQRPAIVAQRRRFGDWEADTVAGCWHRGYLVSLVERKSRFTLLARVPRLKAEVVGNAVVALLRRHGRQPRTITMDHGREFAGHQRIADALGVSCYFAHPYAAWERGTVENTNGLIRQYFPKKHDFSTITDQDLAHVMHRLNHRPRKCLGFKSPHEVFSKI
jgi:IS30 family transposase